MGPSLSVIQKGLERHLVLLFFPSAIGSLRSRLKKALGPAPTIVIDEGGAGEETLEQLIAFTRAHTGIDELELACLGGYSAGCQRVRALRLAGANSKAFVFIDGAHASLPPQDWQIDYLRQLAAEARGNRLTLIITHTYVVTEPKYTSTAAVARLVTGWDLPMPPAGAFAMRADNRLIVYSLPSAAIDVMAHSAQAQVCLPVVLEEHVRPLIEPGYVPLGTQSGTHPAGPWPVPEHIWMSNGAFLHIENQYLPRVVTAENGHAAKAALQAQAIAARTYLLRAMQDNPRLGTVAKPVSNSESFQKYASTATAECIDATRSTEGVVATYRSELILGNYVAGASWTGKGNPGADPTNTEKWVTHNEGMTGTYVRQTPLVSMSRWQNRGCMGQNGSDWLARHGYNAEKILRYFYGADLLLMDLRGAQPLPSPPPLPLPPSLPTSHAASGAAKGSSSSDDGAALLIAAGAGLTWMLRGTR